MTFQVWIFGDGSEEGRKEEGREDMYFFGLRTMDGTGMCVIDRIEYDDGLWYVHQIAHWQEDVEREWVRVSWQRCLSDGSSTRMLPETPPGMGTLRFSLPATSSSSYWPRGMVSTA